MFILALYASKALQGHKQVPQEMYSLPSPLCCFPKSCIRIETFETTFPFAWLHAITIHYQVTMIVLWLYIYIHISHISICLHSYLRAFRYTSWHHQLVPTGTLQAPEEGGPERHWHRGHCGCFLFPQMYAMEEACCSIFVPSWPCQFPYGSQMFSVKINGYCTQICMEIRTTRWDDEFLWTDHLVSHQFLSCNDKFACFLQILNNMFRLFKNIQAICWNMLNKLDINQNKTQTFKQRAVSFSRFYSTAIADIDLSPGRQGIFTWLGQVQALFNALDRDGDWQPIRGTCSAGFAKLLVFSLVLYTSVHGCPICFSFEYKFCCWSCSYRKRQYRWDLAGHRWHTVAWAGCFVRKSNTG